MKKTILLTILIVSLALSGCALKKSVKVDENNQAKTQDNAVVSETANTSNWQTFNEEENGVKKGVLSNFKFPKDWFTYNFSGGTVVEIFFSDGGDLANKNLTNTEITNRLQDTEPNILIPDDIKRKDNNECNLSIFHNGLDDSYSVRKYNTKNNINSKKDCESIITLLEKQVPQN